MNERFIKPKTMDKLKRISKEIYRKFGKEANELSNFLNIINEENKRLAEPMTRTTISKYIGYIAKSIINLEQDNKVEEQKIEIRKAIQIEEEVKELPVKTLQMTINFYSDGTYEKVVHKAPVVQPVVTSAPQQAPYVLYLGLFDYNYGKIVIRKGGYTGCNIKNPQSILEYFRSMKRFEDWCEDKMEDVFSGRLTPNPDTSDNMRTLNNVLNKLRRNR